MNIWDYKDCNYVEVTTKDNRKFTGMLAHILDEEEFYDLPDDELEEIFSGKKEYTGDAEDELTIFTSEQQYIGFKESEIKSIRDLSDVKFPRAI
jgi:hypothetical protein